MTNRPFRLAVLLAASVTISACVANINGPLNLANGASVGVAGGVGTQHGGTVNNDVSNNKKTGAEKNSPAPSPQVTPTNTPAPAVSYLPMPSAVPTATPGPDTSAPATENATIMGKVFDENGLPVTKAKLSVRSLSAEEPFDATVDVVSGGYVVNGVPRNVQLEVTAWQSGWTRRTQIVTVPEPGSMTLDFGGKTTGSTPFFISNRPEVEQVEMVRLVGFEGVKTNQIRVRITFSEAFKADVQSRIRDAIKILKGAEVVLPNGNKPLESNLQFDPIGQTCTFFFTLPTQQMAGESNIYSIWLSPLEPIKDSFGNELVPQTAFRSPVLSGSTWEHTHVDHVSLEIK